MKLPRPSAHRYASPLGKGIAWAADALAVLVLVAALVLAVRAASRIGSMKTDYSTKPPEQVFQMVLNQPVPPGVSNIRVAGFGLLSQEQVWMKFSAADAAIDAMLSTRKLSFRELNENEAELRGVLSQARSRNALAVGWGEIAQARRIESYSFQFEPYHSAGWVGVLVVDRVNHKIYVQAGSL